MLRVTGVTINFYQTFHSGQSHHLLWFQDKSITKYEGMDACGASAWNVIFEEDPAKFTEYKTTDQECSDDQRNCFDFGEGNYIIMNYNDPYTYIPNCKPYTPYAIYVTTVMEKTLAGNATGAQSDIVYARTNETNPTAVTRLSATSQSPNSLEISWNPPNKPNGIIDQYIFLNALENLRLTLSEITWYNFTPSY